MNKREINQLVDWITTAQRIVIMTGAGVSAESGIATFREAKDSLWAKFNPQQLASPEGFANDPETVWQWYQWRRQQVLSASPNPAHGGIAKLQLKFDASLVTQNVDGLHQKAGSPEVFELHGNLFRDRCNNSVCSYQRDSIDVSAPLTLCPQCESSYLRPSVVWFGESLSAHVLDQVTEKTARCDLFISVGTSAEVYPAAGFADLAQSNSARILEINPNVTVLSTRADWVIAEPAGKVFQSLMEALEK